MVEPPATGSKPRDDELPEGASPEDSFWRLIPRLFLIPLFIVAVCVGVFFFFGQIAFESQTLDELITVLEVRTGPLEKHPRWQASYEIAVRLTRKNEVPTPAQEHRLIKLFRESPMPPESKSFLALTLGYCPGEESKGALVEALGNEHPVIRGRAAVALGVRGAQGAVPALVTMLADEDRAVRNNVVGALATLGGEAPLEALRRALHDPAGDVRVNAALSLSQHGDAAGVEVLLSVLEPGKLGSLAAYTEEQSLTVTESAIRGLADLAPPEAVPALEGVKRNHEDFRIRQAANLALERIASRSKQP